MTDWDTFWTLIAQLVILCGVLAFMIAIGVALFIAVRRELHKEHDKTDHRLPAEVRSEKAP
jgi:site-specific recombinase